jgi:hypothetical protein
MVIRINPSRQSLWRENESLQIGHGRDAVALGKLSNAQQRLLAVLYIGVADKQLPLIGEQTGNTTESVTELLEQLDSVLIRDRSGLDRISGDEINHYFSEIMRTNLTWNEAGEQLIAARKNRRVYVENFAGTSIPLILGLAASGIGTIYSTDYELVKKTDVYPGGFPEYLVGKPRSLAVEMLISSCDSNTTIKNVALSDVIDSLDFGILLSQRTAIPTSYAPYLSNDVAHLAIVFDEDGGWISPVIQPGKTPCLSCLHSSLIETETDYLSVATQLTFGSARLDDAARKLFTAGLAVERVIKTIDSPPSFEPCEDSKYGYRLANSGSVEQVVWSFNSLCSCRADG